MKKLFLVTLLGSFVLTGCGDGMPPKCDSKDAKNTLIKIFMNAGIKKPSIHNQKQLSVDNENGQYLCQAYVQDATLINSRTFKYSISWHDSEQQVYSIQVVD